MKKSHLAAAFFVMAATGTVAFSQTTLGTFDGEAAADASASANPTNNTVVGGNLFDFSNGASGLQVPPPPLANIAAGVCAGGGITGSMSVTGLAVGMGRQNIDDGCNRRAWVQALLGAAQQLGPNDAAALRAAAIEVMKGDPIVRTAFDSVGITDADQKDRGEGTAVNDTASMSSKDMPVPFCVIYTTANAPQSYVQRAEENGCDVRFAKKKDW